MADRFLDCVSVTLLQGEKEVAGYRGAVRGWTLHRHHSQPPRRAAGVSHSSVIFCLVDSGINKTCNLMCAKYVNYLFLSRIDTLLWQIQPAASSNGCS